MKTNKFFQVLTLIGILSTQALLAQTAVFEWANQMGGASFDSGQSIAIDVSGNVYTIGSFEETVDFDPGDGIVNLESAGESDVFVQKMDANGNFLWVKQMGGPFTEWGLSIALDPIGNVYTTGAFHDTADFDPGPEEYNLISAGGTEIFVQKLDTDGNFLWAKQMGSVYEDWGKSIAVDAAGNTYTTGRFQGTADFDPGIEEYNFTTFGGIDIFVQKLDTNGDFIWARQMGGTHLDQGSSIEVDSSGSIYITGNFSETVDFDPGIEVFNLTSGGGTDIYVQKLDSEGNFIWAQQMGGASYNAGTSLAVDSSGSIYTTGYFQGTGDFNQGGETISLTSAGVSDFFVQKLDSNGNFLWVKQMGGASHDVCVSITMDASGNLYTTGSFQETADFASGVGTTYLTSLGDRDVFVQKLDANGELIWVTQIGGEFNDYGSSIAIDASGNIFTTGYFVSTADFDPGEDEFNLTSAGYYDVFIQKISQCNPTSIVPDVPDLPLLSLLCEITDLDAPAPTATDNCALIIAASADVIFPITDFSISQIVWTYNDGNGNVFSQNQPIDWPDIDVSTTQEGLTITALNPDATYQWVDCDNSNSSFFGETNQSYTPIVNGNYAVEITQDGCTSLSECISITTVSVNDLEYEANLHVYPNPSNGLFNLEFETILEEALLTVTDMRGRVVSTQSIERTDKAQFEINEAPGIYLLTIQTKEGQRTIQLFKE